MTFPLGEKVLPLERKHAQKEQKSQKMLPLEQNSFQREHFFSSLSLCG